MAKYLKFLNGFRMPSVGLGTYGLNGDSCKRAVDEALSLGYRHFDTALSYKNEKDIGETLCIAQKQDKIQRKDVFITTKTPSIYLSPQDVQYCVKESLDNLKVTYLDLVLIHNPWGLRNRGDGNFKPVNDDGQLDFVHYDLVEAWKALESLVKSGLIRSIGLSNFNVPQIQRILQNCKIKPSNVQLECHAYYQQAKIKQFCDSESITLSAYSPLGSPERPEHHRLEHHTVLLEDQFITHIASDHRKTPAQILLRWLVQNGFAVLPKSQNYNRMKENIDLFDFNISSSDIRKIQGLDRGIKYFHFEPFKDHPEFHEGEQF